MLTGASGRGTSRRRFLTRREPLLDATAVDFLALADGKIPVTGQVANAEA